MGRRGVRLPPLPSRLLSVVAFLPAADAVPCPPARPAPPAGASTGLQYLLEGPRRLDLECAAPARAAGELGEDDSPRLAGEPADAEAGEAGISRRARPYRAGKGRRPRHQDREALRHSAQDRRQGRSCRPGLL